MARRTWRDYLRQVVVSGGWEPHSGLEMKRLCGVGASCGVVLGPAHMLGGRIHVRTRSIAPDDAKDETLRLERAMTIADAQIARAQAQLQAFGADEARDILEMHRLLLRSDELAEELHELIARRHLAAESAVRVVFDRLATTFDGMTDPYFRERRSDLESVSDRLLRVLLELPEASPGEDAPEGGIAVATDLSALYPFQLKRAGLKGIVTEAGGRTSHAALVARALGLPYVLGVAGATLHIREGTLLLIDGASGEVIVQPDEATVRAYEARASRARDRVEKLRSLRSLPSHTLDDTEIQLAANIESADEVPAAIEEGAAAVGLFRTELLYLERDDLPSEQEQFEDAVATLRALGGRSATFRTLDVAPDKLPAGLALPRCANPALGLRSIRYSLRRLDIFKTQLRALYRASAFGPLRIMFPLIATLKEVRDGRETCRQVRAELDREGIAYDPDVPIGIMIETPSAAWTADHLARECDFFSIGTNDLIQYTFAADRENDDVGYLYKPLHPAILRTIAHVIAGAAGADIPVSLCGDMASDPSLTWILLGLGLRSFSMEAPQLPAVKAMVRATWMDDAERLAQQALSLPSEDEIDELVRASMSTEALGELRG